MRVVLSKGYWSELDKRNFYPDIEYEVNETVIAEMENLKLIRIKDGIDMADRQREKEAIRSLGESSSKRKRGDD